MDLATVLQHAQSPDHTTRTQAEAYLYQAAEAQYGPFLLALCAMFGTEGGAPLNNRQVAGLYLKNIISANDADIFEKKIQKWRSCDEQSREQIKNWFIQSLASPEKTISHTAAQIIAAFGAVDVAENMWPALVPTLLNNVINAQTPPLMKTSSLEALGYMCESLEPGALTPDVANQILSALIHGMQPSSTPGCEQIQLAGITALINSLEFVDHNFNVDVERDAIMQSVCQATQSTNAQMREKAYECMTRIVELYYDKLERYVSTIYTLSTTAIRSDTEDVAMRALDFWQTLCECELGVLEDHAEGNKETPYLRIAEAATPTLLPILLETLTKQPDNINSFETRSISFAGAECLGALARVARDLVVQPTVGFISQNLGNPNWRLKEASINAFGAVMCGPQPATLQPIISQALAPLVSFLQDANTQVRATTAWTLARICEYHKDSIPQEHLPSMVNALLVQLEDKNATAASQACFAIHNLAAACAMQADEASNLLSHFIAQSLQKLFVLAARDDADEENLRINAYEAIGMIVENSARDVRPVIIQVYQETLNRLEASFGAPSLDANERAELQGNLCGLVGRCVQKLDTAEVAPLADRTMGLVIQVFNTKSAPAHEDAFLVMGYIADKLGADFVRYLQHISKYLLAGLKNYEEYQLCTVAVACVSDVCRAIGPQILVICDDLVRHLLELLQAPNLHKSVKPHALSCFADIAMAINGDFERYLNLVVVILKQASLVVADPNNEDSVEHTNALHAAILEAYSGIIHAFHESNKQATLQPVVPQMFEFTITCFNSEHRDTDVMKNLLGVIGDLGHAYGKSLKGAFRSCAALPTILQEGAEDEDCAQAAQWATDMYNAVLN